MEDFLFGNVKLNVFLKIIMVLYRKWGAKLFKTFKCVKLIFSSINQAKKTKNEENLKKLVLSLKNLMLFVKI